MESDTDPAIRESFDAAVCGLKDELDLYDREYGDYPAMDDCLTQRIVNVYFTCLAAAERAALDPSKIPADLVERALKIPEIKRALGLK